MRGPDRRSIEMSFLVHALVIVRAGTGGLSDLRLNGLPGSCGWGQFAILSKSENKWPVSEPPQSRHVVQIRVPSKNWPLKDTTESKSQFWCLFFRTCFVTKRRELRPAPRVSRAVRGRSLFLLHHAHENVWEQVCSNITTPCRPARICRHHLRCTTCACPGRAAGNRRARRTWAAARAAIL